MNNFKLGTMKKVIIILMIMFILPAIKLASQTPNFDKLNAYKIGFFTKKLNLTSEEAEKFWPVYNDYQKQKNIIQQEKISLIRNFNQNEGTLNDQQLTEISDKLVAAIVQESSLAVPFHKKLKEVLPPAKVIRFYQAENQYKAQLLNELQGIKQQQKPNSRRNF
jgi:hypothetical protein